MTRRIVTLRVLAIIVAIATMAAAQSLRAQCCRVNVRMAPDICPVSFCIITPIGRICNTYNPGTATIVQVPCDAWISLGIQDACGNDHVITAGNCADNVVIAHNCCVKICLEFDHSTGCFSVNVSQATGPCLCP